MRRLIAAVFILAGLAIGAIGISVLPGSHGRFEYVIEIADRRAAPEAQMPPKLAAMGAVRAVIMSNPSETDRPRLVLLLPEVRKRLRNEDCAIGVVPKEGIWQGLAGFDTGLERETVSLAGHQVAVCGLLQPLSPVFDRSLVMEFSPAVETALRAAGWQSRVSYFLLAESWDQRNRLLDELSRHPDALPSGASDIVSGAEKPLVGTAARRLLSALLICSGLLVIGWQLRSMSREEVARRFGRS